MIPRRGRGDILDKSVREQSYFLHRNKHGTSRSNLSYTHRAVAFFDRRVSWRSFGLEKSRDARSGRAVDPHLLPIKMSAAITSLTLTEEDLLLLIKSEVLDAKLKDLPSLQSHLDSCRADRVRARIVDCSGCLVYKTDMVYSALSGVPSVGRLRSELTAHFEQVEASYHEEVQAAINTVGQRVDEGHDGGELGTFSRSPIYKPNGGCFWNDATRFVLDGIAWHRQSSSVESAFVGEFFICNIRNKPTSGKIHLLLRNAHFDPSSRHGDRRRGDSSQTIAVLLFSALRSLVTRAVRDDSLELELGPELFSNFRPGPGLWMMMFPSLEVKKRFVEFVEIFELAIKIDLKGRSGFSSFPIGEGDGVNIANIVTRIMHKPEILRRLEEPHRSNFDNNNWWYLCSRGGADLAFSLMAAESVDESQNKVLWSGDQTSDVGEDYSLVDLIGAPEVLPDEDGEDERLIQLRINNPNISMGQLPSALSHSESRHAASPTLRRGARPLRRARPLGQQLTCCTDEDLQMLIKSGVLDAELNDLSALESHLDRCRDSRVRIRVVDCSGHLVYKTDMLYSALSGVPSVGRLRSELTAHFEQVEASYREEVQGAIKRVYEDHRLKTDGNRVGTVFRGVMDFGLCYSGDATRFVLDGVAFHSRSLSCGPVAGDFFMTNKRDLDFLAPNSQRPSLLPPALFFQLRNADRDLSLGDDGSDEDDDLFLFRYPFRSSPEDHPRSFSAFSQYVMGAARDDSLELVLPPELFRSYPGAPYAATFSSLEVKKRFVEFVEILELARKIAIEEPGSQHLGLNIGNIVTRIMHKSEILRRLEEPHRTNFDNNDWWYLTRNYADLAFSLMAAESVDESQNKVLSDDHTSLVDLIGAPEVLPDEDGEDERLIQLRITTRKADLWSGPES